MTKHPQGVNHREEFEDVRQIGLLSCRELAALVGHRVVMALVVRLREDSLDRRLAGVCREHTAAARIKSAKDRGRRQATFQGFEALLLCCPPAPRSVRTTQPGERGCNLGVALDKATVVVAQTDELAQLDV